MSLNYQLAIVALVLAVVCFLWYGLTWMRQLRSSRCYSFNPLKGAPPPSQNPLRVRPFTQPAKHGFDAEKPFHQGKAS